MRVKGVFLLFVVLSLAILPVVAQGACPDLVERALSAVSDNCGNLQRNTVCYGFNQVRAEFVGDVPDDYFAKPSDRADITNLQTLRTTSIQLGDELWGVAVMSLQADVPGTLPGQAVTFVLLGDSEIENGVSPADAYVAPDPIAVTVKNNANIRSGPGLSFNTIGTTSAGSILQTDARSEDAQWVRVIYQAKTVAWISRIVLNDDPAIDALPVPNDETRSAMQAFYLRTGIGRTECAQAPQNALMVQGPQNVAVNLTVNGASVKMGSTVLFQVVGDAQDQMQITVLEGHAEVTPNIPNAETVVIPQGFSSKVCLSNPEDLGVDGQSNDRVASCNPSEPEKIDEQVLSDQLCGLQAIPTDVLNYAVDLQCPGDPTPTPTPATVATRRPTTSATQAPTPSGGGVDCSSFAVIAPTFEVTYYGQYFQWTSAPGADQYAINLFNVGGGFLTGAYTGLATGIILDIGDLEPGGAISWQALALKNDQVVCTTTRTNNLYVNPKPTPTPTPDPEG